MLKQVFKLTPNQYESLYLGEVVTSSDTNTTLQLNTTTFALTVNGSTTLSKTEYSFDVSDKYLTPDETEDMLSDIDTVASTQDVANLFGTVSPEARQFIVDLVYPVGSIYTTVNSAITTETLHNTLGGTWEALNSGNAMKVPTGNAPVITGDAHSVSSGYHPITYVQASEGSAIPTYNRWYNMGYDDTNKRGYVSTTYVGSNNVAYYIQPNNLYADNSSGVSVYMFKRIA